MKLANYRLDIQGLRAIAVILVVITHSQIFPLAGGYVGVDIFFVISGFIITATLMRELETNGKISLSGFYARRFLRLLPTATIVIVVIVVGTTLIMSPVGSVSVYNDATWSDLFAANFRFLATEADYFAQGSLPSPFQHYWSLSVEEQFYALWPLLLIGTAAIKKDRAKRFKLIVAVAVVLIVSSLISSIVITYTAALLAYFSPITRAWELCIGALIAILGSRLVIKSARINFALVLVGLAAILLSAFVYGPRTPFPGFLALVPVLGAAALIVAGNSGHENALTRYLIANRFMVWIGSISYALYLWHWVTLTLWHWQLGKPADPLQATGLIALAVGLAWATTKFIEKPIRNQYWLKSHPLVTIGSALAVIGITVAILAAITQTLPKGHAPAVKPKVDPNSSSRILRQQYANELELALQTKELPKTLTPPILNPDKGTGEWNACFQQKSNIATPDTEKCVFGDPEGTKTYWLIGDSHARNWMPALNEIAKKRHAKLIFHARNSCPFIFKAFYSSQLRADYLACPITNKWYVSELTKNPADALFYASYYDLVDRHLDENLQGLEKLSGLAKRTFILGDTPGHDFQVPQCLARHSANISNCTVSTDESLKPRTITAIREKAQQLGLNYVDTYPWVCKDGLCPAVINKVMIYRDAHHLTMAASSYLTQQLYMAVRWKLN